jgi:hypothetical protein
MARPVQPDGTRARSSDTHTHGHPTARQKPLDPSLVMDWSWRSGTTPDFRSARHERGSALSGFATDAFEQVRVGLGCDRQRTVLEPLAHHSQRYTGSRQEARRAVAEIVQPIGHSPVAFTSSVKRFVTASGANRPSECVQRGLSDGHAAWRISAAERANTSPWSEKSSSSARSASCVSRYPAAHRARRRPARSS